MRSEQLRQNTLCICLIISQIHTETYSQTRIHLCMHSNRVKCQKIVCTMNELEKCIQNWNYSIVHSIVIINNIRSKKDTKWHRLQYSKFKRYFPLKSKYNRTTFRIFCLFIYCLYQLIIVCCHHLSPLNLSVHNIYDIIHIFSYDMPLCSHNTELKYWKYHRLSEIIDSCIAI